MSPVAAYVEGEFAVRCGFDVPAWLITILDGATAYLLWVGYRRGIDNPWLGLSLTLAASIIMMGRALWFVIIPLMIVVTIAGSIRRIMRTRKRGI